MNLYLEMSRDEDHGGGSWGFSKCIWAPTIKEDGSSWPFWTKVSDVKKGDIIIHLKGIAPHAYFVGFSTAASNGYISNGRPPLPKGWEHSPSFFRADLTNFIPFSNPLNLSELFQTERDPLELYFDKNRAKKSAKRNIFYVKQSGRLQCLNGAYLSDVDQELFDILCAGTPPSKNEYSFHDDETASVSTNEHIKAIKTRIGQSKFAEEIKKRYQNQCCFPDCKVTDGRFLIGAHIARWADNATARGDLNNGLCLCLMHDKAFEIGLYTLDDQYRVFVNPNEPMDSGISIELTSFHSRKIRTTHPLPSLESLKEHRDRSGIQVIGER